MGVKDDGKARMRIWCCGCGCDVDARLTDGSEIYPHRLDLRTLPLWRCDTCGNYVGCHHKTKNITRPLGCIPTAELRGERKRLHETIDSIWQSGAISRVRLYDEISQAVGWRYHTAETRTIEDIRAVYCALQQITGEGVPA